jgi:hypothetical protein
MPNFQNNAVTTARGETFPSTKDAIELALSDDPLFLDRPVYSDVAAAWLSITPAALSSLHWRGSETGEVRGPKYTHPYGSRRRVYTTRSILTWLYSDDPAAKKYLKRKKMVE